MSSFAELLAQDMKDKDFQQADLAKALAVSQQTVSNWLRGENEPPRARKRQIAQILGPKSRLARLNPAAEFRPIVPDREGHLARLVSQQESNRKKYAASFSKIEKALAAQEAHEHEFRKVLPSDLQQHAFRKFSVGNAYHARPDYLSDRVCAEIKTMKASRFPVTTPVMHMLVALATVRLVTQGQFPDRRYVLILLAEQGDPFLLFEGTRKLQFEAGVLGVDLAFVANYEQAASVVERMERGEPDGPTDQEWEVEDDDPDVPKATKDGEEPGSF